MGARAMSPGQWALREGEEGGGGGGWRLQDLVGTRGDRPLTDKHQRLEERHAGQVREGGGAPGGCEAVDVLQLHPCQRRHGCQVPQLRRMGDESSYPPPMHSPDNNPWRRQPTVQSLLCGLVASCRRQCHHAMATRSCHLAN